MQERVEWMPKRKKWSLVVIREKVEHDRGEEDRLGNIIPCLLSESRVDGCSEGLSSSSS